jgi:hypothetical protein
MKIDREPLPLEGQAAAKVLEPIGELTVNRRDVAAEYGRSNTEGAVPRWTHQVKIDVH